MAANIAVVVGVLVFALGALVGAFWEYSRKGGTYDTEHELLQVEQWLSSRSLGNVTPYHLNHRRDPADKAVHGGPRRAIRRAS
jgi:hypothetical protein